mmetsp:Transcript_36547/g.91635  ORF Transcript_36547/g.91635 Transcript_36547/m.91635 type:complete len:82 (+) Transcript_36547:187-432(+)
MLRPASGLEETGEDVDDDKRTTRGAEGELRGGDIGRSAAGVRGPDLRSGLADALCASEVFRKRSSPNSRRPGGEPQLERVG